MGFFSRISREGGELSDTPKAEPVTEPAETPSAGTPVPAPKPEATPEPKPGPRAAGASGSWPGGSQDKPAMDERTTEEPKAEKAEEPKAEKAEEAQAPAAASSNGTPPDLIPPDAAPVPKRVSPPVSDDDDDGDDEAGEVRLRAEDIIAPTPKRPHPFAPQGEDGDGDRRARVISFANQKGGVAKTTTTLNLAVALAEQGNDVLIIDLDPQGNLTMSQGIDPESVDRSMYDVLVDHLPITEVIQKREVDIAVASIDLAGAEIAMSTQIGRERSLQKALRAVGDDYDFVCIDTPPSLGLLTINALTASDRVIVPVQCEYLSMRGLAQLQNTLEMIRENLNPDVQIEGILATMMDSRTVHAKEAVEILEESFGDLVFKTRIKKAVKFAEAPVRGTSVLKYDPEGKAAEYYRRLAQEVLSGVKA